MIEQQHVPYSDPKALAHSEADVTIHRYFTDDEIADHRERYTDLSLELAALDAEKEEFNTDWKARQKPKKAEAKALLTDIKQGFTTETRRLLEIINEETGRIDQVDPVTGEVLANRVMTPEERKQVRLQFTQRKTA